MVVLVPFLRHFYTLKMTELLGLDIVSFFKVLFTEQQKHKLKQCFLMASLMQSFCVFSVFCSRDFGNHTLCNTIPPV